MNGFSAQGPDPLDPLDFGFLDPCPQKYSQGVNINQNCRKKLFTKPKSELFKKERLLKLNG